MQLHVLYFNGLYHKMHRSLSVKFNTYIHITHKSINLQKYGLFLSPQKVSPCPLPVSHPLPLLSAKSIRCLTPVTIGESCLFQSFILRIVQQVPFVSGRCARLEHRAVLRETEEHLNKSWCATFMEPSPTFIYDVNAIPIKIPADFYFYFWQKLMV